MDINERDGSSQVGSYIMYVLGKYGQIVAILVLQLTIYIHLY